jgi:hypothetical protein
MRRYECHLVPRSVGPAAADGIAAVQVLVSLVPMNETAVACGNGQQRCGKG